MNENTKLVCIFHQKIEIAPRDPKTGLENLKAPKVKRYIYSIETKGSARDQYIADMEELSKDGTCPMILDGNMEPTDTPAYFSKVKRNKLIIERGVTRDGELRGYFPVMDEIDEINEVLKDEDISDFEKQELGSINAKNRLADIRARVAMRSRIVTKTVIDDPKTDNTEKEPESENLDGLIGG